jgi:succinate dehydrogenase / fumarate reductase iron-sulfur subunit
MRLKLEIWRQASAADKGSLVSYEMEDVSEHMSFLEMLDVLNERLTDEGEEPIAFEHDCREGICGSCGVMIDGVAHGPFAATATCQLHMRRFSDGDTLRIEPFRSRAFPVIKDLVVDRSPLDRIIESGGFVSVNTGSAPEANLIPVPKPVSDRAMDAAECIGCGACVAQCPNGAAQLFTAAKVSQLAVLPQGKPERGRRVLGMVDTMEGYFGTCSNFRECEAVCPKEISVDFIGRMNHEYLRAHLVGSD